MQRMQEQQSGMRQLRTHQARPAASRPSPAMAAITAAAALALTGLAGTAQAAAEIAFDPASTNVAVGDVFEVVLHGLGFDQTATGQTIGNLTGGQNLNFSYSSGVFEIVSITIDPRWTFAAGNRPGTIDPVAGTVTGTAFGTFPATPDDAFDIATFTLRALAPGNGMLDLVSGQFIGQVNGASGQLITPAMGQAQISVVPEPQQWALMLAGLGFVALRLRRG